MFKKISLFLLVLILVSGFCYAASSSMKREFTISDEDEKIEEKDGGFVLGNLNIRDIIVIIVLVLIIVIVYLKAIPKKRKMKKTKKKKTKRKKLGVLVLFCILLFGLSALADIFVSAETSEMPTNFTIPGCADVSRFGCFKSPGSPQNAYFCGISGPEYVLEEIGACFGVDGTPGTGDDCCPFGYYCDVSAETCVQNTETCDYWTDSDDCIANNCEWIDDACRPPGSYGCFIYETEESCEEDAQGYGQTGLGSEECRMGYVSSVDGMVVVPGSCRCDWNEDDSADEFCEITYNVTDHIWDPLIDPIVNTCRKRFELSECVDSQQTLTWTITSLEGPRCQPGNRVISCGKPLLSVPGFSFISFILVFLGLGIFYFIKEREK